MPYDRDDFNPDRLRAWYYTPLVKTGSVLRAADWAGWFLMESPRLKLADFLIVQNGRHYILCRRITRVEIATSEIPERRQAWADSLAQRDARIARLLGQCSETKRIEVCRPLVPPFEPGRRIPGPVLGWVRFSYNEGGG